MKYEGIYENGIVGMKTRGQPARGFVIETTTWKWSFLSHDQNFPSLLS